MREEQARSRVFGTFQEIFKNSLNMGETSRFESQQTREVKEGVENMMIVESGESKGGEEEREPLSLKKQRNPRPDKMLLSKYHVSKCFQSNIRSSVFGNFPSAFFERKNGITDPLEPITFPYRTTQNLVFCSPA